MNAPTIPADRPASRAAVRRRAAEPAMKCECGQYLVQLPNGSFLCYRTAAQFEARYGYKYGEKP